MRPESSWRRWGPENELLFWVLNASGWGLLYVLAIVLVNYSSVTRLTVIYDGIVHFAGFLICIPLRYHYRAHWRKRRDLGSTAITILTGCTAAAMSLTVVYLACDVFLVPWLAGASTSSYWDSGWHHIIFRLWYAAWPFLVWSIIYHAVHMWLDYREEERRAERAIELAHRAQLEALRYQINPHFLFNALNSVRTLIVDSPDTARDMITDLAELFRHTLTRASRPLIPLREEMRVVESYLAIEKRRFEDRLDVRIAVAPGAEDALVPGFMIQPLVENAVKYGRRTSPGGLRIDIACQRSGSGLRVEVANSGSWLEPGAGGGDGAGTGLANLRERLEHAYGKRQQLSVAEDDGLVRAVIEITDADAKEDGCTGR